MSKENYLSLESKKKYRSNFGLIFQDVNSIHTLVKKKVKISNEDLKKFNLKNFQPKKIDKFISDRLNNQNLSDFFNKNDLLKFLIKEKKSKIFFLFIMKLVLILSNFLIILFQDRISKIIKQNDQNELIIESILMIFVIILSTISDMWSNWLSNLLNQDFQLIIKNIIFRKIMSCRADQTQKFEITNLINSDVQNIAGYVSNLFDILTNSIQVVIGLVYLYLKVKEALFAGFGLLIIVLLLQFYVSRKIMFNYEGRIPFKDKRISLIQDIIRGIKQIKVLCWENHFIQKIQNQRENELKFLKIAKYMDALCGFFWGMCSVIITSATLVVFQQLNEDVHQQNIFLLITLFNSLIWPLNVLPWNVTGIVNSIVSNKRVMNYLKVQDIDFSKIQQDMSENALLINNLDFFIINNDNKSDKEAGKVTSEGDKGNQNQEIQTQENNNKDENTQNLAINNSIQQNKDSSKIDQNIKDQSKTKQKENVKILNNIDVQIKKGEFVMVIGQVASGKSQFLKAILNELDSQSFFIRNGRISYACQNSWLQTKTIKENILFGKQLNEQFYQQCVKYCSLDEDFLNLKEKDQTVVQQGGVNLSGGQKQRICICRALYSDAQILIFDDILSSIDLKIQKVLLDSLVQIKNQGKTIIMVINQYNFLNLADKILFFENGQISKVEELSKNEQKKEEIQESSQNEEDENENKEEFRETGYIKFSTILLYFQKMGFTIFSFTILVLFSIVFFQNLFNIWLQQYLNYNEFILINDFETTVLIFTGITLFCQLFYNFFFQFSILRAAKIIYYQLQDKVLYAQMKFFDTYSIGSIVSRLSNDTESVDSELPWILKIFLGSFVNFIGSIVVLSYQNPYLLIVLIIITFLAYYYQLVYRNTSREVKRLVEVNEGSYITFIQESIQGVQLIRAFDQNNQFRKEANKLMKNLINSNIVSIAAEQWIDMRMEFIVTLLIITSLFFQIAFQDYIGSNSFSIIITYSITLFGNLRGLVWSIGYSEKQFISFERINQFFQLERQNDVIVNESQNHAVEFNDICMEYITDQLVMKNISFKINFGQKVAFVGRSGSGKSSILNCLFQLYPIKSGQLLTLNDIKQEVIVIPQNGFLFQGTILENIDPFQQKNVQLVEKMYEDYIKKFNQQRINDLKFEIESGGKNLSNGEKQIINFFRAIINQKQLVCLDEATSNLDPQTEQIINQLIVEMKQTVILITHRIESLKDFDQIYVLDHGIIIEKGSYQQLLENKKIFNQLVKSD